MSESTQQNRERENVKEAAKFMETYLGGNLNTSTLTPFAIQEMMTDFAKRQSTDAQEVIREAVEALEGAIRIESLWLLKDDIKPEHRGEALALLKMRYAFGEILEKLKAL